jgi:hypothetical protein
VNLPFVVFSLPRSRSAWLSVFLGAPDRPCGHDIGPTLDHPGDLAERLRGGLAGTCETGAAFAWPLIRGMLPEARFVVVWREPAEVARSLARFGWHDVEDELQARARHMAEIAALPGTLSVEVEGLADERTANGVYRHCHGRDAPAGWWAGLDRLNVQVDMSRQIRLLTERRPQIEAMKAEARRMMADA